MNYSKTVSILTTIFSLGCNAVLFIMFSMPIILVVLNLLCMLSMAKMWYHDGELNAYTNAEKIFRIAEEREIKDEMV